MAHDGRTCVIACPIAASGIATRSGEITVRIRSGQDVMFGWARATFVDRVPVLIEAGFKIDVHVILVQVIYIVGNQLALDIVPRA